MKAILLNYRLMHLFVAAFLLSSCKDNNVIVLPNSEEPEILELKLRSHKVVEFQSVINNQEPVTLGEEKVVEYFGSRVLSFLPVEIKISHDSTTFVKPSSFIEKYRSKWENKDELYVYNGNNDTWSLLGKKSDETFVLKSAFFFKKVRGKERNGNVLGQAYALENYDSLISGDEQYNLVWLRIDALFN